MTAEADNDNGNGKVTMAVLGVKIDGMTKAVSDLVTKLDEHCQQSNVRDNRISVLETTVGAHGDEIKGLRSKSDFWNGLNSLGVIIAGVLGVNK